MAAPSEELFDIRTVERKIARGQVDPKEHQKWLNGLEDCAELCEDSETVYVHLLPESDDEAAASDKS